MAEITATIQAAGVISGDLKVAGGIVPTGNLTITDTASHDVSAYATAQVVDADLIAGNIKKDVNILGVTGTYEGSSGTNYEKQLLQVCDKAPRFTDRDLTFLPEEYTFDLRGMTDFEISFDGNTKLPQKFSVYAPNATYAYSTFSGMGGGQSYLSEVTLTLSDDITSLYNVFYNAMISKVTLQFSTSKVKKWNMFAMSDHITDIRGTPLNCSAMTACTNAFRASALVNVAFTANTIPLSISFTSANLSNASIVSIANGLNSSVTGKTLTLESTVKAKCATIMGTVTDGTFAEDSAGSVSLESFITTTKGWSLA